MKGLKSPFLIYIKCNPTCMHEKQFQPENASLTLHCNINRSFSRLNAAALLNFSDSSAAFIRGCFSFYSFYLYLHFACISCKGLQAKKYYTERFTKKKESERPIT